MWTEHTSTAVRLAAAGVGIAVAPDHVVRGATPEHCAVLSASAAWRRPLTVFSRAGLSGAAAAFAELLGTAGPAFEHFDYTDCAADV